MTCSSKQITHHNCSMIWTSSILKWKKIKSIFLPTTVALDFERLRVTPTNSSRKQEKYDKPVKNHVHANNQKLRHCDVILNSVDMIATFLIHFPTKNAHRFLIFTQLRMTTPNYQCIPHAEFDKGRFMRRGIDIKSRFTRNPATRPRQGCHGHRFLSRATCSPDPLSLTL